ncbi:MAG: hypothetical protein ABW185_14535 [Sedimenticola sp.]
MDRLFLIFRRSQIALFCFVSLLFIHTATMAAFPPGVEFSASIRMSGPQGEVSEGHLYVRKGEVRADLNQNGQQLIQISSESKQLTWLINPAKQTYIEHQHVAPGLIEQSRAGKVNPCQGLAGAECLSLGEELLLGRPSEKWSVTINTSGTKVHALQWIDAERKFLIRQEADDGGLHMEQRMFGTETLNGRLVEKWEVSLSESNKAPVRSYRWFDPELNVVIREEHPGGYVQEMKGFKISEQNPKLFAVPAGFSKVVPD